MRFDLYLKHNASPRSLKYLMELNFYDYRTNLNR